MMMTTNSEEIYTEVIYITNDFQKFNERLGITPLNEEKLMLVLEKTRIALNKAMQRVDNND